MVETLKIGSGIETSAMYLLSASGQTVSMTVHHSLCSLQTDPYEAVTDLLVTIVSESEAVIQWNHTDECEVADHYEVVVRDFTGDSVFNETTKGLMKVLEHLRANGKYEVTVSMIGKDGGRGEATSLVFKAGEMCVCVCVCLCVRASCLCMGVTISLCESVSQFHYFLHLYTYTFLPLSCFLF